MLILNGGADKGNGQRGDDGIRGRGGDDLLKGGRDGDYFGGLVGGSGDDRLLGGEGRDHLSDRLGANVYRGGLGDDLMQDFGRSDDFFFGGKGRFDHVFWAGFQPVSADLTTGHSTGFGEDTLVGVEELEGGAGSDTLTVMTLATPYSATAEMITLRAAAEMTCSMGRRGPTLSTAAPEPKIDVQTAKRF